MLAWTGEDDYHCFGAVADGEFVGVAGVLLGAVLHHASHARPYDLVVDEPRRGEGRTAPVEAVECWGDERDCQFVALAPPLATEDVHGYYETLDDERWGYALEKER